MKQLIKSKFEYLIILVWYLLLFPGRLGYDGSLAIRMIQNHQSTDWWTATYFWFMRLTTLNGKIIFITSLIQIATLYYAINKFILGLNLDSNLSSKARKIFICTPLFGYFGLTVSHDVFLLATVLLITQIELEFLNPLNDKFQISKFGAFVLAFCASTSKIGIILVSFFLVRVLISRRLKKFVVLSVTFIVLVSVPAIGIAKTSNSTLIWPFIADLKCVAQNKKADITSSEWRWLLKISPKQNWEEPITCSNTDLAIKTLELGDFLSPAPQSPKISTTFVRNYTHILEKNAPVIIMAHINRARVALPPPFFPVPANQVDLTDSRPLGEKSNIALQDGPELLHPSVDEQSVQYSNGPLRIVSSGVQLSAFLINQASWFWGWGGMWLWFYFVFYYSLKPRSSLRSFLMSMWPTFTLHIFLLLVAPSSLPRYVESTITVGCIFSILVLFKKVSKPIPDMKENA